MHQLAVGHAWHAALPPEQAHAVLQLRHAVQHQSSHAASGSNTASSTTSCACDSGYCMPGLNQDQDFSRIVHGPAAESAALMQLALFPSTSVHACTHDNIAACPIVTAAIQEIASTTSSTSTTLYPSVSHPVHNSSTVSDNSRGLSSTSIRIPTSSLAPVHIRPVRLSPLQLPVRVCALTCVDVWGGGLARAVAGLRYLTCLRLTDYQVLYHAVLAVHCSTPLGSTILSWRLLWCMICMLLPYVRVRLHDGVA